MKTCEYDMPISIDEAEKIATEFIKKKRNGAKDISINSVVKIDENKVRLEGSFQDPAYEEVGPTTFEIFIEDKTVYQYKFT